MCAATAGWAQEAPSRSLLNEMKLAEQADLPASVHTQFAIGNGLFLDTDKVVVARHTVLTPEGQIAKDIGVGSSRPPLHNIMESRSVAIAQDPEHDLALLELLDDDDAAGSVQPAALSAGSPPAHCGAAHAHRRHRHHARKEARSNPAAASGAQLLQTRGSGRAPVRLRIVWDGPLVHSR